MRVASTLAAVVMVLLGLSLIPTSASASHIYTSILTTSSDGEIKVTASGSVYCNIEAAEGALWNKLYDSNNYKVWAKSANLGSYQYINGYLYTILEAPGWFDHAYRRVDVYEGGYIENWELKDATWKEGWTSDTNGNWAGGQFTSNWPVGDTGRWSFIVEVWGTDYGSQTCRQKGLFTITY